MSKEFKYHILKCINLSFKVTCFLEAYYQGNNEKKRKLYWPSLIHVTDTFQTRTSRLSCEFVSNVPRLLVPMAVHILPPLPVVAIDIWFSS